MIDVTSPIYDNARIRIDSLREANNEWEAIEGFYSNLKIMNEINGISEKEWIEVVREVKTEYEKPEKIKKIKKTSTIISAGSDNEMTIPTNEDSTWVLYKNKLKKSLSKDSIENLENDTYSILKKLNAETNKVGEVKGLVIGQVQSGKTASMAALIAMAADWDWNTFIIMSGMVDNLRIQTQKRLINDLKPEDGKGHFSWRGLDRLSKNMETNSTQHLDFSRGARDKYINVVLKNKIRLENLIAWMKEDANKLSQMRILLIDDEADQASVNTKKLEEERAKINELIIELVNVGKDIDSPPKSMNFISYTATPYANFLNESGNDTLYPKDFIGMLTPAKEYFGPREIFGYQKEIGIGTSGLNIIRNINEDDLELTKELQSQSGIMPEALIDSLCWFLIGTSFRRYYDIKSPTSMLVHTSQMQSHHQGIAEGINTWLNNTSKNDILQKCEAIYLNEQKEFSMKAFRSQFRTYPESYHINDYPSFNDLEQHILTLVNKVSHIKMDGDGELNYIDGIHLCIDNCSNTGINDENQHIRLAYPSRNELNNISQSPAFIIIGGSTLSRGLTIEGLVSTYFLRATKAADTLMQMGRWFGYRRGYELIPRIWMTEDTRDKFDFLTEIEEELREELKEFSKDLKSPSEYGPRVKNTEMISWLRVTAANKMQSAVEVDMDFTGASIQTIHFENNPDDLKHNIDVAEDFLENNCGTLTVAKQSNSIVYRGVSFDVIRDMFLRKMRFHQRSRTFNNKEAFISWFEAVEESKSFEKWNVIVPSSGKIITTPEKNETTQWSIGEYKLNKVSRTAKTKSEKFVSIGVLRAPNDIYADIDNISKNDRAKLNSTNKRINYIRNKYGVDNVPQLIIYRIDKESRINNPEISTRKNLDFENDIIGVYIRIPGSSSTKPNAKALVMKVNYEGETTE